MKDAIHEQGFALVPNLASANVLADLRRALNNVTDSQNAVSQRGNSVYGRRNLLRTVPEVQAFARSATVRAVVQTVLEEEPFAVRAIFFDKTPDANWQVAWHQDVTIAVAARTHVPGFGSWSEKAGVVHVQPPVSVLENMVALRLHLDDCGSANGPLKVLAGTHRFGQLIEAQIQDFRRDIPETICLANAGDALLMRPLLLHASGKAELPGHRRVLHLDWSAQRLPDDLQWHDAL